jgi:hypothetical protein
VTLMRRCGLGRGLDHAPGRGWWADRQTDVRGLVPQFGYSQKGAREASELGVASLHSTSTAGAAAHRLKEVRMNDEAE